MATVPRILSFWIRHAKSFPISWCSLKFEMNNFILVELTVWVIEMLVQGKKVCAKTFETLSAHYPFLCSARFQISKKKKNAHDTLPKRLYVPRNLLAAKCCHSTPFWTLHAAGVGLWIFPHLVLGLSLIPLAKCPSALRASPKAELARRAEPELASLLGFDQCSIAAIRRRFINDLQRGHLLSWWRFSVGV